MNKNKLFSLLLAFIISVSVFFTGCDFVKQEEASEDSSNAFIGTWQLLKENGEKHTLFSYIFEDEKQAYMAMDNVAYGAEYKLNENDKGQPTLAVQFYYNLNGTYVYEFSDNGNKVTLTEDGVENGTVMTLVKVEDFNFMPQAPENPEIDEKLVGLWNDTNNSGISYEFFDNGTLIYNNYNVMITYAQYSAKDGTINITYKMGTEVTYKYSYSFDGETLNIDGIDFVKQ